MVHRKSMTRLAAFLTVLVGLTACETTAEDAPDPTASVETIGPFEISPAASAGEQDVYRGRVTVASDQRVEIDQLGVYVSDSAGNDVYNYVLDEPTARDSLPKRTGWGGTNDVGNYVPDGTYTLRVEVIDSVGQRARSNLEPVVVDNTRLRSPCVRSIRSSLRMVTATVTRSGWTTKWTAPISRSARY
jgi:hypothetical protein